MTFEEEARLTEQHDPSNPYYDFDIHAEDDRLRDVLSWEEYEEHQAEKYSRGSND